MINIRSTATEADESDEHSQRFIALSVWLDIRRMDTNVALKRNHPACSMVSMVDISTKDAHESQMLHVLSQLRPSIS